MLLRRVKPFVAIAVSAAGLVYLSACGAPQSTAQQTSQTQGQPPDTANRKPAPDFSLQDANGSTLKLSDLHGKVVLLNFWATWCGPCQMEIPWFVEFEQDYRSKGLEVVGISMDEDGWKVVKPYVQQHKMNYRVVLGNESVGQLYGGVDSLPTTFVIDRSGKVAFVHVGLAPRSEYQDEIQKLLGGAMPGANRASITDASGMLVASTGTK